MIGLVSSAITQGASAQIAVYDPANYAENVLHYVNQNDADQESA